MTLWHYIALRIARNPILLEQETPSPKELANFLWILSPQYRPESRLLKWLFYRRCKRTFFPPRYLPLRDSLRSRVSFTIREKRKFARGAIVLQEARSYVSEVMQDRPPVKKTSGSGFTPDYFSDGALFCSIFAREYGWDESVVLRMPMKRIWQYVNEIKSKHNPKAPLCNPSDAVSANWIASRNQSRKESN